MLGSLVQPDPPKLPWLPPLGLTAALHLLLLLALFYGPGLCRFRPETRDVCLVTLLDAALPAISGPAARPAAPPAPAAPSRPAPTKAKASQESPPARTSPSTTLPATTEPLPASQAADGTGTAKTPPGMATEEAGVAGRATPPAGGGEGREPARQRYLARLMAHIEANKFYPPAARRRRLEGRVRIRFTLEADGMISGLTANDGDPLLAQAARQAVERSLPLPRPGAETATPLPISYQMQFQLH